jgi:hypothetical protein
MKEKSLIECGEDLNNAIEALKNLVKDTVIEKCNKFILRNGR